MSLIATVAPEQASGTVAELYEQIRRMMGRIPNAFRLSSASPELLEQHWHSIRYYMQHPTLSFPLLAMIRMLVSQHNDCSYCVNMNESMLMQAAGLSHEQLLAARRDPAQAPLPQAERAMLQLVLKATSTPKQVGKADLDAVRALGWTDRDILDAVSHGARNVAVDIVFNTFKIDDDL